MRSLLDEATALLNDVHKANGMNRTLAHQYDHLKKRVEKVKKGQKISRASSVQKHQNEIIEELRKELEKVLYWNGCIVWCGVVWCGVVWCGVVWCGVVWCGVVWCGVVWCGVVWCGVVWCGVVIWYGMVWYGMVLYGTVWYLIVNYLPAVQERPGS